MARWCTQVGLCVVTVALLGGVQSGCVLPGDSGGNENTNVDNANGSGQDLPDGIDDGGGNDGGTGSGDDGNVDSGAEQEAPPEPDPDCGLSMEDMGFSDLMVVMSDPFDPSEALFSTSSFGGMAAELTIQVAGDEGATCSGFTPDVNFEIEDTSVRITAALVDDVSGDACVVEMEGVIDDCGLTLILGQPAEAFHVSAEGTATIGGQSYATGGLQILRLNYGDFGDGGEIEMQPCVETPTGLEGMDWSLSNESFGADIPFFGDPFGDIYVNVGGSGDQIEWAEVYAGDVESECYGEGPEGVVTFDGQAITVDVAVEAFDFEGEPSGQCTFEFSGEALECLTYQDPYSDGESSVILVAFEGTGRYATNAGDEGELTTMTLTLYPPEPPREPLEDLCVEPIVGFGEADEWVILSANPFAEGGIEIPALSLGGTGPMIEDFGVLDPEAENPFFGLCTGPVDDGELSFDGQALGLTIRYSDEFADCGATFAGAVASCETEAGGYLGEGDVQVLRVVGEGSTSINGGGQALTEVFILRSFGGSG